jgi:O-acetyl-ADP-ribose deacetylase (regulator of RNase III)
LKELRIGNKLITLARGDITRERVDAIVNAANSRLAGGGGVDGAIHRAGGPSVMRECDEIRASRGGCATGEAVSTTAGDLHAKRVIHTVGPVWSGGGRGEAGLLESCYRNSMRLAEEEGLRTIAFPSISTGAYRFPVAKAASIALGAVADELASRDIDEVRFILFSGPDLDTYAAALEKIAGNPRHGGS